jgi:hypothetical protein
LDLTTMNVLEKLFVLLVIGATPGDGRHYEFIRNWRPVWATCSSAEAVLGAPPDRPAVPFS